jgi:hypothetical protein
LSSIRISDILQIQILGVQKCAKDISPYVRKCADNALAKLSPRGDAMQPEPLLDFMKTLLDTDTCINGDKWSLLMSWYDIVAKFSRHQGLRRTELIDRERRVRRKATGMAQDGMGAELDALDLTDTNHSPNNQAAP